MSTEGRAAPEPLVAPSTWRNGSLVSGSVMMLGATGIMAGAFFLNSLHLQNELGFSALETGLAFPAISITAMSDVPHASMGTGSGVMSTFHEVGAALGVAALSAIAFGSDYRAAAIGAAIAGAALTVLAATLVPAGVGGAPSGAHAMMH